jgi:hypothetical protein
MGCLYLLVQRNCYTNPQLDRSFSLLDTSCLEAKTIPPQDELSTLGFLYSFMENIERGRLVPSYYSSGGFKPTCSGITALNIGFAISLPLKVPRQLLGILLWVWRAADVCGSIKHRCRGEALVWAVFAPLVCLRTLSLETRMLSTRLVFLLRGRNRPARLVCFVTYSYAPILSFHIAAVTPILLYIKSLIWRPPIYPTL